MAMIETGAMPTGLRIASAILVSLGTGVADASEQALHDLRLVAEARPTRFSYDWTIDGAQRSGDDELEQAFAAGLGVRWGWGRAGSPRQVFVGGEVLAVDETFGSGGRQGWIGRGEVGAAWSPGIRLMWTAGLFAGGGWSEFNLPTDATAQRSLAGATVEYGVRAGARVRLDSSWSISVEAGWLAAEERYSDGGAELSVGRSGGWLGLALGYAIDARPRAID